MGIGKDGSPVDSTKRSCVSAARHLPAPDRRLPLAALGQANIIACNLFLSDPAADLNGFSTWTLVCCTFFPFTGSDLSATATHLLFDFSGTDGGGVDFADPTLDFQLCLSTAGGAFGG